jgi:polyhydroxyalkanoate synthesis regulator protein
MGIFDEQIRQNMALFDRAMKMFTPFAFRPEETAPPPPPRPAAPAASDDALAELKKQMAAMQAQIAELTKHT